MSNCHIWIVEAKPTSDIKYFPARPWRPVLGFPGIPGAHLIRQAARDAAREMEKTNWYNREEVVVRYRARKYFRA